MYIYLHMSGRVRVCIFIYIIYINVCVCVCVRARARACVFTFDTLMDGHFYSDLKTSLIYKSNMILYLKPVFYILKYTSYVYQIALFILYISYIYVCVRVFACACACACVCVLYICCIKSYIECAHRKFNNKNNKSICIDYHQICMFSL
jgi:hypothetical protein